MSVARSVADVLQNHVSLEVECIDQMYLNVYQPRLQAENQVVRFNDRRGFYVFQLENCENVPRRTSWQLLLPEKKEPEYQDRTSGLAALLARAPGALFFRY